MKTEKIWLFAVILALAVPFQAQGAMGKEGPCKPDIEKFCKDAKGKDLMDCLKTHEKDLSESCKARMAAPRNEACKADAEKFCKDAKGKARLDCMKTHEKDLSAACKANIAAREKKNPCLADMKKFCKDVKMGEGRLMECLKAHEAELSAGCKAGRAAKKAGHKRMKGRNKEASKDAAPATPENK